MSDAIMASGAEEGGEVIGYMCLTDWEFEIGNASGGNRVYASIEDIKTFRPCVDGCGIVEVEVRFRRVIEPPKGD